MDKDKVFITNRGALIGRIDPSAYKTGFTFSSSIFSNAKLSAIAKINPQTTFAHLEEDDEISFVPMEAISEEYGMVVGTHSKPISKTKGFTRFRENDLLWAKITPCMQNGKSAIAKNLLQGYGCGSTEFFIIRANESIVIPEYLHILLRDERVLQCAQNYFGGSAGQQRVSVIFLENFSVPLPPLDIQREIVALFQSAYESKRQKEAEAKQLLAGIDAYLMQELGIGVEGSELLKSSQPSSAAKKPFFYTKAKEVMGNRWDAFYYKGEFRVLENALENGAYSTAELGKYLAIISYGASIKNEYVEEGIPFLRISDLKRNEINVKEIVYLSKDSAKEIGNCFVYENDFLISRSGTTGIVALIPKSVNGFAYGSFMIKFSLKVDAPIDKLFLSYYLNSEIMQKIIDRNRIGAIQGNITIPTIKNFKIPLPPLSKQQEIAAHISELRSRAKQLQAEAAAELAAAKAEVERRILGG